MKRVIVTDLDKKQTTYYPDGDYGGCGITAIGYSLRWKDSRQLIIHPNAVYSIEIEEINENS